MSQSSMAFGALLSELLGMQKDGYAGSVASEVASSLGIDSKTMKEMMKAGFTEDQIMDAANEENMKKISIEIKEGVLTPETIFFYMSKDQALAVYLLSLVKMGDADLFDILGKVQMGSMDKIHKEPNSKEIKMIWKHGIGLPLVFKDISRISEAHKEEVNNLLDMLENFDYRPAEAQVFNKKRDIVDEEEDD